MKIVIYKLDKVKNIEPFASDADEFEFVAWTPSLTSFLPPDKDIKYFVYWFFHFFGIFKNKKYSSVLVYHRGEVVTSLLVVPAHFKWPFMSNSDLQFTYVMTRSDYRGKGLAEQAIRYALNLFSGEDSCFWYVTDTGNPSSIKLCTKLGFEFHSYGVRSGSLRILKNTADAELNQTNV